MRSSRHNFAKKIQINVESFTLTAKLKAVPEKFSFLRCVCVQNEVHLHLHLTMTLQYHTTSVQASRVKNK